MYVAFLPLAAVGTVNVRQLVVPQSQTNWSWIDHVRHMTSIFDPSLPLRVYEHMSLTHNTFPRVVTTSFWWYMTIPFHCVSYYLARFARFDI